MRYPIGGGLRPVAVAAAIALCWLGLAASASEPADLHEPAADAAAGAGPVGGFLEIYCLACHDASSAEGDREFENFRLPLLDESQLITADEIIDQVTLGQMPPPDADQPSDAERIAVVEALRRAISESRDRFESTGGRTVMRRLSHREYENTLATLLGRRVDTLGLTADFPRENADRHIEHIGASMVTSGFLLDQYFAAANRLIETRLGKPATEPQTWHFKDHFKQYEELEGPHRQVFNFDFLCLYEQPDTDTRQGSFGHIEDFLQGVPVSGLYDIEVLAKAMHRDTHYDPKIFRIDFSEPFELAVVPGDVTKGHIHYPQAIQPILDRTLVPDDQFEWLTFRVWLEAGQTPRFIFPNGPYESRQSVIEVNKRYSDEFKDKKSNLGVNRSHILREGALPHIRIDEIKICGPLPEPKGSLEELAVFGVGGFQPEFALEQLQSFARRAYRRPLEANDIARIERLYQLRLAQDASPRQAALDTLKMILCSPSFLYFSEITPEAQTLLHPYDLASRLSYTLWSAPPDETLDRAAAAGDLADPEVLRRQIVRMLEDKRSDEFVRGFVDSWLNLRDIGSLPPPRTAALDYYAEDLPVSMKEEVRTFFRHMIESDGSISDFLEADYTFVDKKLAKLYRLPEKETLRLADGFQRVSLEGNRQRGGLLGMAAVLTVSANGVDTSPVTRGVWVLENLLGSPPPPPPDEVPAIESDVSGATTIRQRLAKHSADQTCQVCHRKIDPMGFALESFDPIGRWRDEYEKPKGKQPASKVDASGELPSGETYEDFSQFKVLLAELRKDAFERHLIEHLLAYSTGRHMERVDRFEIDEIHTRVRGEGNGLRTLITEALSSEIFRSR